MAGFINVGTMGHDSHTSKCEMNDIKTVTDW